MKKFIALAFFALACCGFIQGSSGPVTVSASCSSSILDTSTASPGAWTAAYSLRKLRAAFAGNAIQLQRSSDNATQDIGFTGCDPDQSVANTFCSTQTLSVGASSSRVAFPTGSIIKVFNQGPNAVFYAAGNGTVTATTASTQLTFKTGTTITVGANTNLAALVGTGYGINGTAAATLFLTNCGVSKVYDQTANANDQLQATQSRQMGYMPNGQSSKPILFGCSGCGLKAADSASYKTAVVNTFAVMTYGEDLTTTQPSYAGLVYPTTTSANASNARWGLVNDGYADLITAVANGSNTNNFEGVGGIYRGQNITVWDYCTGGDTRVNGTLLFASNSFTPTYPNAVGMYLMTDAANTGSPGMFVEGLVASGCQTGRNTVASNQTTYWGITLALAQTSALTNPLGDGFNFNRVQSGGFNSGQQFTINGTTFFTESSWNDYTQWICSNCITTGGRKGDMVRFVNTLFDVWDGTNRSELDGASAGIGTSAQYGFGVTVDIAYAVFVEAGTSYSASWNTVGQHHTTAGPICCVFSMDWQNNTLVVATSSSAGGGSTTTQYTSPTLTRGQWYNIYIRYNQSSAGNNDTFIFYCDCVTPGTMVQQVNLTGASLYGGNANGNAGGYWKYGNYRETQVNAPTFAVRYGNMQICSTGTQCTTKYGTTDLSAQATTPLPAPSN